MIAEVKKTTEDELREVHQAISRVWFDMGRTQYEIEVLERLRGELSTKAHNLNQTALKLNDKIAKEKAAEEGLKVKLADAPAPETQAPEVTQ